MSGARLSKEISDGLASMMAKLAQETLPEYDSSQLSDIQREIVMSSENVSMERQGQEMVVKHKSKAEKSLNTTIPFIKNHNLDYAEIMAFCGKYKEAAGWILFVVMTIIVVTAVSNGANLNDGMDGMCAGNSAVIGVALGILAYVSSHIEYAAYLNIMYIPGSEELVVFICAFVGAMIGFLWYNAYPTPVFP